MIISAGTGDTLEQNRVSYLYSLLETLLIDANVEPENVLIAGSASLIAQKLLDPGREPDDLDVVANADAFARLERLHGSEAIVTNEHGGRKIILPSLHPDFEKIEIVDSWPMAGKDMDVLFERSVMLEEGLRCMHPAHVIESKLNLSRQKDFVHLGDFATKIESRLDNLPKSDAAEVRSLLEELRRNPHKARAFLSNIFNQAAIAANLRRASHFDAWFRGPQADNDVRRSYGYARGSAQPHSVKRGDAFDKWFAQTPSPGNHPAEPGQPAARRF